MITIRVKAFRGQPPAEPLVAEFDETGGTIGRGTNNQLVLPDPEKHISRVQATILFRNGQYLVLDQGSVNPVVLNGRPLGNGAQAALADGDDLRMGDYAMQVSVRAAAPAARAEHRPAAPPPQPAAAAPAGKPEDDLLAILGGASAPPPGAFSDLFGSPPASSAQPSEAPRAAAPDDIFAAAAPKPSGPPQASNIIPEDFDPFADKFGAKPLDEPASSPARLPDDFDLGLGPAAPAGSQSIDELFGLGPASQPASGDPFAIGHPLGEQLSAPNTAPGEDALSALGAAPKVSDAPLADRVPEIHGSFRPPPARPEAPPPPPRAEAPAEGGIFLSWEAEQTQTGRPAGKPAVPAAERAPAPPPAAAGKPQEDLLALFGGPSKGGDALGLGGAPAEPAHSAAPRPAAPVPPRPAPQGTAAPPRPAPAPPPSAPVQASAPMPANADAMAQAFLAGLGTPNLQLPQGLTPETMQLIGVLLREAVQGTLDLLLARAMTKREVRADVTMIVGKDNNPLKFSPDAGVALAHLLNPQMRGFMPPAAAMQDAYDDLRSHTFGFMAGMRAALAGVLARFDPHNLEQRLTQKSVLDSLLPMNRRAKLWDLFSEMYQEISREAEDDFHALFGKEFLRAYEEQVARLEERNGGR
jgi:FHA domain-containing protein